FTLSILLMIICRPLVLASDFKDADFGWMVEWSRICGWLTLNRVWITCDISRNFDLTFQGDVAGFRNFNDLVNNLRTGYIQGVVDNNQAAFVRDQGPDLVDQLRVLLLQIDFAIACAGKEGRVENDGIKQRVRL